MQDNDGEAPFRYVWDDNIDMSIILYIADFD
jgi:hypothetical protein